MKSIIGLDYGSKRIGVAVCAPGSRLAAPHSTITHKGWGPSAKAVMDLALLYGADTVVLGLPRNMDGSLGFQAREALGFKERLESLGLTVRLQDETLSSFQAEQQLKDAGYTAKQIKDKVDQCAAAMILQDYLNAAGQGGQSLL